MKSLVALFIVSVALLLGGCSPKPTTLPSAEPLTTSDSQESKTDLRLEYKKMDEDFFYFTLVNETDNSYIHIVSDDVLKEFRNEQWLNPFDTKSAIYMTAVVEPQSTTEIVTRKPEKKGDEVDTFKLTIKLQNDDVGNEELTCEFEL